MTTATTSMLAMSPLQDSLTSNKRKRVSESPFSVSSMDFEDGEEDDGSCSSSTTTPNTPKTKAGDKMDPARAARLKARAARNRVSAQHSRDRKKNHVVNLEAEVVQLRSDKAEMMTRIKALEDLVKTLLGATKGAIDPSTTVASNSSPSTTTLSLSQLTSDSTSQADTSSTLCISPQALSQRVHDSTLLAAPTSLPITTLTASSHSSLPLDIETIPNESIGLDARLPAAGIIDLDSGFEFKQSREDGNRKQSAALVEQVNGSSSKGTGSIIQWESSKGCNEQRVEQVSSNGQGLGEENNWLAQYLEGMLESTNEKSQDSYSSEGQEGEGQEQQVVGSQDQDGTLAGHQQEGMVEGGNNDVIDFDSLLVMDQLVDVDIDIEEANIPLLEVIGHQIGLAVEV